MLACDETGCREPSIQKDNEPTPTSSENEPATQKRYDSPSIIVQSLETDPPSAEPPSDDEQKRAERDLDAQEAMARWAFWMFIATAAGVGLIGWTLIETRTTANIARRSLKHAGFVGKLNLQQNRKAINAAVENIDVTRKTGEAQTRAYINARKSRFSFKNGSQMIHFWLELFNSGNSPARNVRVTDVKVGLGPRAVVDPQFCDLEDIAFHEIPAQSDAAKEAYIAFDYTAMYASELSLGDIYLFVRGRVTFLDVFNKEQTTEIAVSGWTQETADAEFVFHGELVRVNPDTWDKKP